MEQVFAGVDLPLMEFESFYIEVNETSQTPVSDGKIIVNLNNIETIKKDVYKTKGWLYAFYFVTMTSGERFYLLKDKYKL